MPQPLCCLLHREVAPFVTEAIERGEYKVFPVLETAGRNWRQSGVLLATMAFCESAVDEIARVWRAANGRERGMVAIDRGAADGEALWFANLNTPEEFAEAERHLDALDT